MGWFRTNRKAASITDETRQRLAAEGLEEWRKDALERTFDMAGLQGEERDQALLYVVMGYAMGIYRGLDMAGVTVDPAVCVEM